MSIGFENSTPRAGVLIPTTGERTETLKRTLDSVASQTLTPETIVVCPHASLGLVRGILEELGLINAVRIEIDPKAGLSLAIEIGVRAFSAQVRYVTWIGDDDLLHPSFIEELSDLLESNSDAPFAYGSCRYLGPNGHSFRVQVPGRVNLFRLAALPNPIAQPSTLIRRSALTAIGGVDKGLKFAMDLDLWLRFCRFGRPAMTKAVLASYSWHGESLSGKYQRQAFEESVLVRRRHCPWYLRPAQESLDMLARGWALIGQSRLDYLSSLHNK